jgi:hypothetical protein
MGLIIGSPGHTANGSSSDRKDSTPGAPAAVELHIEELVLHGFPAGDRHRIGDALQQELLRLIGEQGLPALLAQPLSRERLDGGAFKVGPGAKPQTVGTHLAQTLHHRLSRPERTSPSKAQPKEGRKTR